MRDFRDATNHSFSFQDFKALSLDKTLTQNFTFNSAKGSNLEGPNRNESSLMIC